MPESKRPILRNLVETGERCGTMPVADAVGPAIAIHSQGAFANVGDLFCLRLLPARHSITGGDTSQRATGHIPSG